MIFTRKYPLKSIILENFRKNDVSFNLNITVRIRGLNFITIGVTISSKMAQIWSKRNKQLHTHEVIKNGICFMLCTCHRQVLPLITFSFLDENESFLLISGFRLNPSKKLKSFYVLIVCFIRLLFIYTKCHIHYETVVVLWNYMTGTYNLISSRQLKSK